MARLAHKTSVSFSEKMIKAIAKACYKTGLSRSALIVTILTTNLQEELQEVENENRRNNSLKFIQGSLLKLNN